MTPTADVTRGGQATSVLRRGPGPSGGKVTLSEFARQTERAELVARSGFRDAKVSGPAQWVAAGADEHP